MTAEQSGGAASPEQQASQDWQDRVFDAVGPTMSDAGQESLLELISEEIDDVQTMQPARDHITVRLKETDSLMPNSSHHSSVGLQLLEWRTIAALIGYLPGQQPAPAMLSEISTRFAAAYEAAHREPGEVLATGLEKLFASVKPWVEAPNATVETPAEATQPTAKASVGSAEVAPAQPVKPEIIRELGSKPVSMAVVEVAPVSVPTPPIQLAPERSPAQPRKYHEVEWKERALDFCAPHWSPADLQSLERWLRYDETERSRAALTHLTILKARHAVFLQARRNPLKPAFDDAAVLDDNQFKIMARVTGHGLRGGAQQLSLARTRNMLGKTKDGGLGFDNNLADAIIALVTAGVKAGEYADGKYPTGTA